MWRWLGALLICAAGAARAVELELPATARLVVTRDTAQDRYFAPIAPFGSGALPTRQIDGTVARSAWRIDVAGITPLQLITPLRDQLEAAGYEIVLDCAASACGGYDFRFATEVLPAPNMYVNIRNYHVVTGLRDETEAVSVLASASSGAAFVQIIQAGTAEAAVAAVAPVPPAAQPQGVDVAERLRAEGHVALAALEFESGTSTLGAGPFAVLEALAQALEDAPDMRLVLVGHSDNTGSREANIALARSRAEAVRARLVSEYGVAEDRLEVEGIGYLAPLASNLTEAGREANRRVEAVLLAE